MDDHPTGFRFYPTEEELISFYLHNQLEGSLQDRLRRIIPFLDIYATEPWNLPEILGSDDSANSSQIVRKVLTFIEVLCILCCCRAFRRALPRRQRAVVLLRSDAGERSHMRETEQKHDNKMIGMKKSMVFYVGKAPTGRKTKWKLNEYRAIEIISTRDSNSSSSSMPTFRLRREVTLCRVYVVSGRCRAFDRRPLELGAGETIQGGDGSSGSGGESASPSGLVIENNAGISNYMETISMDKQEPIWDWEKLNWF
ncbi:hypothetical protein BT93_L2435 [Corymbia citriodora subsp. variegata]|uniref:NAC domain-containing protein n=1 Tax=Corymbia citriodora subsp. variegata TaxID=360336 RepID=A0A8T0CP18_CORYI|nr:hypothetical protein BT93_L2435 [Corymbia citriodora subsp. variegata]